MGKSRNFHAFTHAQTNFLAAAIIANSCHKFLMCTQRLFVNHKAVISLKQHNIAYINVQKNSKPDVTNADLSTQRILLCDT